MKPLLPTLFAVLLLAGCKPNDTPEPPLPVPLDLSVQWQCDALGNMLNVPAANQWYGLNFTPAELSLFAPLDTAGLAGTSRPDSVKGPNTYPFPNPFFGQHGLFWRFANNYGGACVLKYVVVDVTMTPVYRTTARLQVSPGVGVAIAVNPGLPVGKYRLYLSLSAQGAPHFYQSWGNIEIR